MVRYSDIIKKGIKKKGKGGTKDPADPEKTDDSLRFSTLAELGTSPELNTLPAQKDFEYIEKLHGTIVKYLRNVKERVKNDEDFEIKQAVDTLKHIINTPDLIENFYQTTALFDEPENGEDYLILHLINVMTCCLKIGTGMRYSMKELLELGLAAMFFDIGFFKIPESLLKKRGALAESELAVVKTHCEIGENILSRFHAEYKMVPCVAHEHHEREDGSGYPRGIMGNEMCCDYVKIVGIADTFDAMIHNRPYRNAFEHHFSIRELVESKKSMYSAKMIKLFLNEIGIFPVGSYVRLNNMEIGRVIATNRGHPLKPTIKYVFDTRGTRVSDEIIIKLANHPVLYVTDAVLKEDLPSGEETSELF